MKVNYNELSAKYDLVRKDNYDTIKRFIETVKITESTKVLDFGCGTGNFTCNIKLVTNADVYGVEPSEGMREKAISKGLDIKIKEGNHRHIPFVDNYFDFIYMTDVIHHIQDIDVMFSEFSRILAKGGFICIVTESHNQIESRFWNQYFPETILIEKKRYPDIKEIINSANYIGLDLLKEDKTDKESEHEITLDFIQLVENKGFSMLHLISNESYERGLNLLRKDYENKVVLKYKHGETLIWLVKN